MAERFKTTIIDLVPPTTNPQIGFSLGETPRLPSDVMQRVSDHWAQFTAKKEAKGEKVTNGRTLYVGDWRREGQVIEGSLFVDDFSKSAYLSGSLVGQKDFDEVVSGQVNYGVSFTTWGVPRTLDGKLVFVQKVGVEYGMTSMSSFGGISNESDLVNGRLDVQRLNDRTLGKELGVDLWKGRTAELYHGMCLATRSATRDQHTCWSFDLNTESGKVKEGFSRDSQFGNNLTMVDNTLDGLMGFMTNPNWNPTCVCIGGVCAYILSTFGDQGTEWLREYKKHQKSAEVTVNQSS